VETKKILEVQLLKNSKIYVKTRCRGAREPRCRGAREPRCRGAREPSIRLDYGR